MPLLLDPARPQVPISELALLTVKNVYVILQQKRVNELTMRLLVEWLRITGLVGDQALVLCTSGP